jgi:hypothetical protein
MKQYVFEVLEEMAKQRSRDDKVKVLKESETWALKDIIRGCMDTTVTWNLPAGDPPYTAAAAHNHATNLTRQNGQFKYFVKGGPGDKLPKFKREQIFIGIVLNMINKKKIPGISRPVVEEAFPKLLQD